MKVFQSTWLYLSDFGYLKIKSILFFRLYTELNKTYDLTKIYMAALVIPLLKLS